MRILVLCQEKVVAEALRCLMLECMPGEAEIVGTTTNGREGVEFAIELRPDVAIVGLRLAELNGVDTIRRIVAKANGTRILALTRDPSHEPVTEAMEAGARGCVSTTCDGEELARALNTVHRGNTYLGDSVAAVVVDRKVRNGDAPGDPVYQVLTPREREVLQLLAEGNTAQDIALKLHISTKTVHTHRRNLKRKLEVEHVADLVKHAIRAGLTDLRPSA